MHPTQRLGRNPFGDQVLINQLDLALAADHADIACVRSDQVIEGFFIMSVAARHDDTESGGVDLRR